MCWGALIGASAAMAEMAEFKHFGDRLKAARTPQEMSAICEVMRERGEQRKRLAVARASAPNVNVTVRNYYW